jgi:hypothetical protein
MPVLPQRLLLGTGLALVLGGCSGTPFGDQLSRSFSNPGTPAPSPAGPGPAARPSAAPAAPAAPATPPAAATKSPPAPGPPAKPPAPASPLQAAPYRVTIKLPAADPSAPAEAVTQALRAAGVSFEVEMIERVGARGGPAPAAPVVTPAPAPR